MGALRISIRNIFAKFTFIRQQDFFHVSGLSWMCHIFRFGPTDAKQKPLGHPLAQNGRYGSDSPFGWPSSGSKWDDQVPHHLAGISIQVPLYRWMVYFMGNPIKMDDWGYPFQDPHIYIIYVYIYIPWSSHDIALSLCMVKSHITSYPSYIAHGLMHLAMPTGARRYPGDPGCVLCRSLRGAAHRWCLAGGHGGDL